MTRTISLKVPENAEAGDVLSFVVEGQEMEIALPVGVTPGDVLEIQVGANVAEDDDLRTKIDLGKGRILDLSSELPKDVEVDDGDDDDEGNDGTHALPWWSGLELTRRMDELVPLLEVPPQRILELGSGLGLVGMAFAVKVLSSNKKASITLSDLPSALPLLQHNLERNEALLPSQLHARALTWTKDGSNATRTERPYDCILGSDLLYNLEMIPALVATVCRCLHPTKGVFVLAVRWRKPELERQFFQDAQLDWSLLIPSDGSSSSYCALSWQDFGNPSCEASNKYFHQTQISINGKPTSLVDITEEETKKLTTAEFEAWERAHIQIYVGKPKKQF